MDDNPAQQEERDKRPLRPGNFSRERLLTLLPIAAGVLLGAALVTLVVAMAVRAMRSRGEPGGIPLEMTRISSPSPLLPSAPPVLEIGETQISLPVPTRLEVGDRSFPVQSTTADEERWPAVSVQPGTATWAYGTVINYVFGLESTSENQEMVEGLRQGDLIHLLLSNGTRLTFKVRQSRETSLDDPSTAAQSRPGLTLALLGEGEDQWVASAEFESAMEQTSAAGGTTAEIGQSVQVGNARLIVTDGHAEPGEGSSPRGTMVYLVEFSVTNTGSNPLSSQGLSMELVDGLGNRYMLSPIASAAGRHGPLSGAIQPGQEREASAGYIVPATLTGPNLTWLFRPQLDSEVQARVSIPYTPEAVTRVAPEVSFLQAFLGEGGEALHIVAEIHNEGSASLTVTADDVLLSSSAGPGELQMAAPPFPWAIAGGDTREVELQFARPEAQSCVITLLGYTSEISGLP
ncbi:MAG: DUF4352 domain-containing protein [Anaerolineae bacterium]|jgi:hypothetical protein